MKDPTKNLVANLVVEPGEILEAVCPKIEKLFSEVRLFFRSEFESAAMTDLPPNFEKLVGGHEEALRLDFDAVYFLRGFSDSPEQIELDLQAKKEWLVRHVRGEIAGLQIADKPQFFAVLGPPGDFYRKISRQLHLIEDLRSHHALSNLQIYLRRSGIAPISVASTFSSETREWQSSLGLQVLLENGEIQPEETPEKGEVICNL